MIVGKGSTGDVIKIGEEVEKNGSPEEIIVYRLLRGSEGIAKGYELNGKVRLPFYHSVISVDTISRELRSSLSNVIENNAERINKAVNELTKVGFDYNDPLQFGVTESGEMDLIDFSMATNKYPDEVLRNNLSCLSRFYKEFGLPKYAESIAKASEIIFNYKIRLGDLLISEFLGYEFDGVNYKEIAEVLNEEEPNFIYLGYTDDSDGVVCIEGVIFSTHPIDGFMSLYSKDDDPLESLMSF